MWQIRKIKEDLLGGIIGLVISFFIITYALSFKPIFVEYESPEKVLEVKIDEEFMYCRTVKYTEYVFITLDKSIVKSVDNNEIITLHYPQHDIFRAKTDMKKICKVMSLPKGATEGDWIIETYVSYIVFPFWKKTIRLNDIRLEVRE